MPTFRYATRCNSFNRGLPKRALLREKKISTDPVAHRSTCKIRDGVSYDMENDDF